ncbi:Lipopolysaccharide export system ATP-binding protein LptB [Pedobacter sp. Bi27]|uniref:ATP-binding cassette domain-containing protein n=1 Tax=unclassified Pedobacter TaxID=2628915 RepID=UPI001DAC2E7A|nr:MULTISPECIES: ATP-binding cassette domain-containing protein [unclassified Pedobacter]CAH0144094.1 Lipopolysaccharide export system ATP-binding protein LptB [Pedobacter sp. Bi126]CAH0144432.1 Lipopolysaccharide export system ATP-binding protein LptB [Pedobacter sp. Bi27]CAH0214257.1 Lipopolysaccharide export system ATP-binding protein LptB [Pedobacter sp. Bi36]
MQRLFIDSVNQSFADREVLSSVYINCEVGEVVGLLGRNGSGKSTLLKIIFGSVKANFKYLNINNRVYTKGYLSKNLSYLPQDNFIPDQINVSQAIDIFCKKHGAELHQVEFVKNHLNSKFYNLSGGERRFLECLLMIYSNAEYVLLDEPFSQLSPLWVDELKNHIDSAKAYKGFIITDHYYKSILAISDRIVLLHNRCNYTIQNEADLILYGYLPGRIA